MNQRFCTECGEPLADEDHIFCTFCEEGCDRIWDEYLDEEDDGFDFYDFTADL